MGEEMGEVRRGYIWKYEKHHHQWCLAAVQDDVVKSYNVCGDQKKHSVMYASRNCGFSAQLKGDWKEAKKNAANPLESLDFFHVFVSSKFDRNCVLILPRKPPCWARCGLRNTHHIQTPRNVLRKMDFCTKSFFPKIPKSPKFDIYTNTTMSTWTTQTSRFQQYHKIALMASSCKTFQNDPNHQNSPFLRKITSVEKTSKGSIFMCFSPLQILHVRKWHHNMELIRDLDSIEWSEWRQICEQFSPPLWAQARLSVTIHPSPDMAAFWAFAARCRGYYHDERSSQPNSSCWLSCFNLGPSFASAPPAIFSTPKRPLSTPVFGHDIGIAPRIYQP